MVVSCGAAAAALAACASIFGVGGGNLIDAATADGAIIDAPPDYITFDAIDFDVNTALCDGGIPISDAAVWVSVTGADNGSCGDQTTPCKTIYQAMKNLGTRHFVYLDNSEFDENVLVTQAGLTIQGGWMSDAGWTPVCDTTLTTIQGPEEGGSAAIEIANAANVTLRLLTVRSKTNGNKGTGESVYAVRATNAPTLAIDNASLVAQNGGAGAYGGTPTAPSGCTPSGGSGLDGSIGAPGDGGMLSGSDFAPSNGGTGGSGDNGTSPPGNAGSCHMCSTQCGIVNQ